jgi:hypothetical protein
MRKEAHNAVINGPSLPPAAETFDVSVVADADKDNLFHGGRNPGLYKDDDVVDVEVVNHSPFLAGY